MHCRESGSTDYYVTDYDQAIQTVRDIIHLHSDLFPGEKRWIYFNGFTSNTNDRNQWIRISSQ